MGQNKRGAGTGRVERLEIGNILTSEQKAVLSAVNSEFVELANKVEEKFGVVINFNAEVVFPKEKGH